MATPSETTDDGSIATIRGGLTFLRAGDRFWDRLIAGGILLTFGFLVFPAILAMGYLMRVLRAAARGEQTPPAFDDGRQLLVDGIRGYAITALYVAIPVLLTTGFALDTGVSAGKTTLGFLGLAFIGPFAGFVLPFVLPLLAPELETAVGLPSGSFVAYEPYIILLLVLYVLPAGLCNFAQKPDGSISDGLAVRGELRPVLRDPRYFLAWAAAFVLVAVGWTAVVGVELLVSAVVPLARLPGSISLMAPYYLQAVAATVAFFLQVAAFYVIGGTWATVKPDDIWPVDGSDADTVSTRLRPDRGPVSASLAYLRRDDEFAATALFGTLLSTLAFVLLPGILVAGYVVRVLDSAAWGDDAPEFVDWLGMAADGLKAYAIWLVYVFVPFLLADTWVVLSGLWDRTDAVLVYIWAAGIGLVGGHPSIEITQRTVGFVLTDVFSVLFGPSWIETVPRVVRTNRQFLLVGAIVTFALASYLLPAALAKFAERRRVLDAFDLPAIIDFVIDGRYARRWLVAIGLTAIGWTLAIAAVAVSAFALFPGPNYSVQFVGATPFLYVLTPRGVAFFGLVIVVSFGYFYTLVAASYLIGRTWGERERPETDQVVARAPDSEDDVV